MTKNIECPHCNVISEEMYWQTTFDWYSIEEFKEKNLPFSEVTFYGFRRESSKDENLKKFWIYAYSSCPNCGECVS